MSLALALAKRGLGQTWPNPSVGCVIVKDDQLISRGWTAKGGRPHAEAMALANAGSDAQGATAYVTLEPCSHTGKTPPCVEALIEAGIQRVVSALEDPDPRVASRGHEKLLGAGCALVTGILEDDAREINAGFLKRETEGLPWVTLKFAASLDGKIATGSGQSQWITGPDARRYVHLLRANHDAILVGSGTALSDDPDLRVRLRGLENRSPVRVVFDTKAQMPKAAQMFQTTEDTPVWIYHAKEFSVASTAATAIATDTDVKGIDPVAALRDMAARGITRVFCEGGGSLAASLLENDLVDELVTFHAGLSIGANGTSAIAPLASDNLAELPRFNLNSTNRIGEDIVSRWRAIRET